MQEKALAAQKQSVLSGGDAYENPPSIMDTMRRDEVDADKVNPLGGSGLLGAVGAFIITAALIASIVAPDAGDSGSQGVRTAGWAHAAVQYGHPGDQFVWCSNGRSHDIS